METRLTHFNNIDGWFWLEIDGRSVPSSGVQFMFDHDTALDHWIKDSRIAKSLPSHFETMDAVNATIEMLKAKGHQSTDVKIGTWINKIPRTSDIENRPIGEVVDGVEIYFGSVEY